MAGSKILLSCVNTRVSLIGFDLEKKEPFWYCPSNILKACSICYFQDALYVSTDNILTRLDPSGATVYQLPGPHTNYAHSIKPLSSNQLGLADTGNSCIQFFDGQNFTFRLSPLESWGTIPIDAIHVNDFLPWHDGLLVSAFSYQPFVDWKKTSFDWQRDGWGVLYYLQRFERKTLSKIVALNLSCPHTLTSYDGDVYCCASATGEWIKFKAIGDELQAAIRTHVTPSHFLRGALRYQDGWILGGSSKRHAEGLGMQLYFLPDGGTPSILWGGGEGEIYDILPWDDDLMPAICDYLHKAPELPLEYEDDQAEDFPPRCSLPAEYR